MANVLIISPLWLFVGVGFSGLNRSQFDCVEFYDIFVRHLARSIDLRLGLERVDNRANQI